MCLPAACKRFDGIGGGSLRFRHAQAMIPQGDHFLARELSLSLGRMTDAVGAPHSAFLQFVLESNIISAMTGGAAAVPQRAVVPR